MLRLLSIEVQKLKYNKSARVISYVYFALICFIALIVSIEFKFGGVNFRVADMGFFNFPFIWHFNTYMAAILKIFLAIVIVSMMANEYSYRTLKQNLIDGLSKREFILSKFMTVIGYAVISTIFVFALSMILGIIFSDYTEADIIFSDLEYLIAYFVKLLGFFSFCLFLGIWVKRSAFAIGFLVIWAIAEGLLYLALKFLVFKGTEVADHISRFFPLNSMSNLIKEPWTRLGVVQSAANQLGEEFSKNYGVDILDIAIVLVWTALFIYWSFLILKRRDL